MAVTVRHCEACDQYHLKGNFLKVGVPKKALTVLRLSAMGYSYTEIANQTGLSRDTVHWYFKQWRNEFNALSMAHVVSIAIALSILDPREFVPSLTENCTVESA